MDELVDTQERRVVSTLKEILRKIKASSLDIESLALVSSDGLPIASMLPENIEEDKVAAMSATITALGERVLEDLSKGKLSVALVQGEKGYVITAGINKFAVLVVITNEMAKLGIIMFAVKKAVEDLAKILD
jgi:predicted regulator of Ras-like GTPase activity (Roadblock/LC7/MglB family)